MYELLTVRPHVREDRAFTRAEYRLYHEGYTMALTMALKVMDLAVDRWKTARKVKQAIDEKRSA